MEDQGLPNSGSSARGASSVGAGQGSSQSYSGNFQERMVAFPVDGRTSAAFPGDGRSSAAFSVDGRAPAAFPVDGRPSAAFPVDGRPSAAFPVDGRLSAACKNGTVSTGAGRMEDPGRSGLVGPLDGRSSTVGDDHEKTASESGRSQGQNGSHVISSDGREFHSGVFDGRRGESLVAQRSGAVLDPPSLWEERPYSAGASSLDVSTKIGTLWIGSGYLFCGNWS
jgi:hypothetical protein